MHTKFKKIAFLIGVLILNLSLEGCYSIREVDIGEDNPVKIFKIETTMGKQLTIAKINWGMRFY